MNDDGKPQSGVTTSWKNAATRTVAAGGVDFAYRDLGPREVAPRGGGVRKETDCWLVHLRSEKGGPGFEAGLHAPDPCVVRR